MGRQTSKPRLYQAGKPANCLLCQAVPPALIVLVGVAVYSNSFRGVFVFDDHDHILNNPRILQLWPLADVVSGARRPVVELTLAINYALGEFRVEGYHAFNLLVHVLAASTLYGLVRRTLLRQSRGPGPEESATWLGLAVSLIWLVHPLQTQSVTYVIQRGEALMGLFYLLTLYGILRSATSSRPWTWQVLAIAACALGMGSKAVMVTAPVTAMIFDRVFLAGSFKEVFRQRWPLHVGLLATWGVLAVNGVVQTVLSATGPDVTVGFRCRDVSSWTYGLSQLSVITQYLRLSFWPHPLCLDYAWPAATLAVDVVPYATLIVILLMTTAWLLWRRPQWGFLGLFFFLVLAPTSSIIPIKDLAFEHRMYLPLGTVVAGSVLASHWALRRLLSHVAMPTLVRSIAMAVVVAAAATALGTATYERNKVYRSETAMWSDVVARRPSNARASCALGLALVSEGRYDEGMHYYAEAIELDAGHVEAHYNLANALRAQGYHEQAIRAYEGALRVNPSYGEARINLGNSLSALGRENEAVEQYRTVIKNGLAKAEAAVLARAHYNLGNDLARRGDFTGAVQEYRSALEVYRRYDKVHYALGVALARQGKTDEAIAEYRMMIRLDPEHVAARAALEATLERE